MEGGGGIGSSPAMIRIQAARPSREALALNRALHACRSVGETVDLALGRGASSGGHTGDGEPLSVHNAAAAMHRVAKLSSEGPRGAGQGGSGAMRIVQLMDATQALIELGEGIEPRHLSMILWSLGKLAHLGTCKVDALMGLAEAAKSALAAVAYRLGDIECSNALWGLARLPSPRGAAAGAAHREEESSPSSSAAALPSSSRALATKLVARAVQLVPSMRGTQGVANIAWAAATLEVFGGPGKALFAAVAARAAGDAVECAPQELSNLCWALAKGGGDSDKTTGSLMALGEEAGMRKDGLTPQHRATIAWALARAGVRTIPRSLDWIFVRNDADSFTPAELAMGCWAGAQWRLHATRHAPDVKRLLESARRRAGDLSASELASILWSEAHLRSEQGYSSDDVASTSTAGVEGNLVVACVRAIDKCGLEQCAFGGRAATWGPQDLANAAWACARLCAWHCEGGGADRSPGEGETAANVLYTSVDRLLSLLATVAARKLSDSPASFLTQHLSSFVWGVAKSVSVAPEGSTLGDRAKWSRLVACVAGHTEARAADFGPRDLSDAMWAFSVLGGVQSSCVSAMGDRAAATLDKFNSQSLLKFLGAFERCGGVNDLLASKVARQRELSFTFPALATKGKEEGLEISLVSHAPGRHLSGTGVALWEASFVLAEWLSRNPDPKKAVRALRRGNPSAPAQRRKPRFSKVVELGAGLGLPSLLVASSGMVEEGGSVLCTDWDDAVLQLLRENARRNRVQDVVDVSRLEWGERQMLEPDLVLACDCIYGNDQAVWRALVNTIVSLCGCGDRDPPLILVANVRRYPADDPRGENAFFGMLHDAGFQTLAEVPLTMLHPDHQRAGSGGTAVHALAFKPSGACEDRGGNDEQLRGREGASPRSRERAPKRVRRHD